MLIPLIKQYWQVSLLRQSPANTPYSFFFLAVSAILFYIVIISQWSTVVTEKPLASSTILLSGFLLILSYGFYTYILLSLFTLQSRMVQTLSCLLTCHTIVHIFSYPLLLFMPLLVNENFSHVLGLFIATIYLFATIGLTVWQFMVTVHIYKSALPIENLSAILASVGLFATNILVASILY